MAFCFEYFFYSGFWQSTTDEEETKIWYRADKPWGSGKNISKNV
jgi:hypothetical protein